MQLPDFTDVVDNLPVDNETETKQQGDESGKDENGANRTAVTAAEDGDGAVNVKSKNCSSSTEEDSVLDVSGRSLEFSILGDYRESVGGLYLYKNAFNLIPKSVGAFSRLKNIKFFGNEIDLFPAEVGGLVGLECLQVKISPPGFSGLALSKLKALKELELCRVPPRPSVLTLLSDIAGLKCLTKLSVCYFSIRYIPPEIGCLKKLEYLDLSFNKIKSLPTEISHLINLMSLKVANNKLVDIPSALSSLQRLETLDLSNNRLTSLGSLELSLMSNLQTLNLQYNKLISCSQIPSWVHCNLEGNGKGTSSDDLTSSSVEMDVYEIAAEDIDGSVSYNGSCKTSSGTLTVPLSNSRCFSSRRSSKRWKRRRYLQQKARQERLNNSRKWKGEGHSEVLTMKVNGDLPTNNNVLTIGTSAETASEVARVDDDKSLLLLDSKDEKFGSIRREDDTRTSEKELYTTNTLVGNESLNKGSEDECSELDASLAPIRGAIELDEGSSSEICKSNAKSKRHSDGVLNNPKPCKCRKPTDNCSNLSQKYSATSYCGTEDHLPDGFYDAGRDRPFMPLNIYEQSFHLDSREIILVDRGRDEDLDAIALSAQALVFRLKHLNGLTKDRERVPVDDLQIATLLALFVSDHFGGSDRSAIVERTRKAVSGSNYKKPFVCTCSTGNGESASVTIKTLDTVEDTVFSELCEKSLRSIKARRNSIIVPIGTLQFGVCRHRALLMKYLCDRMDPPIPCELVRGYLDFMPHAWNTVLINRGDSRVRVVVDACHPHDIREETDPEYFCRYIPLCRTKASPTTESSPVFSCSFPSMAVGDEIERVNSSSIVRCKFGSVEAAAKVRKLEVLDASFDEVKNFELSSLGEVRLLGVLKHPCIVETYGHQISSKWIPIGDGQSERRILQSAILMEYIQGGSLKSHIKKLAEAGEKHVPLDFALCIARDVASALMELHSKHVIHRDIKSENILIDLDGKKVDGSPIVKLCDFDRAVPLRSSQHTCCISHLGIPPPDACVGTPRWMAPEVVRTMHKRNQYGLEVDIWSFGCLLYELLTLQIPYYGLSELQIYECLQMGKRPRLTEELEALQSVRESTMSQSGTEAEVETLRFIVDLFYRCTEENPTSRPTAEELYDRLVEHTNDFRNSSS